MMAAGILTALGVSAVAPQGACNATVVSPSNLFVQFGHSTFWTAASLADNTHPFFADLAGRAQISTKVVYEGAQSVPGAITNREYIGLRTKDLDQFRDESVGGKNEIGGAPATIQGTSDGKIRLVGRIHDDGQPGHGTWATDYLLSYSPTLKSTPTFVTATPVAGQPDLEFEAWILGEDGCPSFTAVGLTLSIHTIENVDSVNGVLAPIEFVDIEWIKAEYHDGSGGVTPSNVGWNHWARFVIEDSGR